MADLYNVIQFFEDGDYEQVHTAIYPQEAVLGARALTQSVGAKIGTTKRVIITSGGDETVFEWKFGLGVVFPPATCIGWF